MPRSKDNEVVVVCSSLRRIDTLTNHQGFYYCCRLHDSKAHLPDHKLTHDLNGDGHIHSGDIEFPVGEQNDRGINGHHTENLFTKELLGESDEYHGTASISHLNNIMQNDCN